nr:uncharacterized protein LOC117690139 isoform X1 [Crassostrea gigas]
MPWLLPIRVSTDLFISLQLVACVCGKDKNFILQVSRLCVEDSIKICDGMEKPPTKKRRGPYGKRNYDSEPLTLQPIPLTLEPIPLTLQPISLTLESLETNVLESTYTLQDSSAIWTENCKLLETSDIMVNRGKLRKATSSASQCVGGKAAFTSQCVGGKAAFTLTSKLAILVFSIEELAQSRGQGLRKAKKGDVRPVLNSTKIEVLKEYVNAWCVKNGKGELDEKYFNDAITEKISYCRKQMKKLQTE